MVKIKWLVADDDICHFGDEGFEEFDDVRIIDGHFLLTVNQNEAGEYNQALIDANWTEGGIDDVFYWLDQLIKGLIVIRQGKEYRFFIISDLDCNLVMEEEKEKVKITKIRSRGEETMLEWIEIAELKEFEEEVCRSSRELLEWIRENNPRILSSQTMMEFKHNLNEIEADMWKKKWCEGGGAIRLFL